MILKFLRKIKYYKIIIIIISCKIILKIENVFYFKIYYFINVNCYSIFNKNT